MAIVALPRSAVTWPLTRMRSAMLASSDPVVRAGLRSALAGLQWHLRDTTGAGETLAELERQLPQVLILDQWLPDIEVNEFASLVQASYASLEILRADGHLFTPELRSPHRSDVLAAIRIASDTRPSPRPAENKISSTETASNLALTSHVGFQAQSLGYTTSSSVQHLIGEGSAMRELGHLIRLVAPRDTTVLIEGPTGSGKELVAQALHALSKRSANAMVVLNCAAIPETLLEAELFGHTRGAFTGATQSRIGRIEAADGGTLLLDEIGEMPLALQAKMLRFLECGEIQRVGDNTISHVNVRVIAATHQPLEQRSEEGAFRLDLYHRLAVFPIEVPPLRERMEDIPALTEHFLDRFGRTAGRKRLSPDALEELLSHGWPGNVRELMHVLERAVILSADLTTLERTHIRIRRRPRS